MGTDIHGRLQYRYDPKYSYDDGGEIEDDRNYRVFAMLAGVRNGTGFAGVYTHEPLIPIAEPRGLPEEDKFEGDYIKMSTWKGDEKVEYTEWLGDHSHSYVTLSELINWEGWDKTLQQGGIVEKAEFDRVEREGGTPRSWCGMASGPSITIVQPEEARAGAKCSHVEMRWEIPFKDTCPVFRAWVDYLALKYGWLLKNDPAAVRLVFGFDS